MQVFSETRFGLTLMLPSLVTNGLRRDKEGPLKKKTLSETSSFFQKLVHYGCKKGCRGHF